MTREEAVKWLKVIEKKYIHGGDEDFDRLREEALQMAIKALSNTSNTLNALDCISRQTAIALLENLFKNTIVEFGYSSYEEANDRIKLLCDGVSDAMEVIETMDSAQPNLQPTCNQLATDCINRQAAIEAINTWDKFGVDERSRVVRWYEGLEPYVHLLDVVTAICNLPSAQPEQKKGKWIGGELGYCSCCGHEGCASDIWTGCKQTYCPNCGERITGINDDEDSDLK